VAVSAGAVSESFARGAPSLLAPSGLTDPERRKQSFPFHPGGLAIVAEPPDLHSRREVLRAFQLADIPVAVYGDMHDWPGCDVVCSGHRQGGRDLACWLISQGARCILRINDKRSTAEPQWSRERRQGVEEAGKKAGVTVLPELGIPPSVGYDFSQAAFEAVAHQIAGYLFRQLDQTPRIDAIMADSDGFVPKIAAALRILGRDPAAILIAGYDNYWQSLPERQWENFVPAATVDKDNFRIGQELVRLLRQRMAGTLGNAPERRIVPPRTVIVRKPA
jgi:DNA-binding LacI/PurR family transcriptional regulator